MRKPRIIGNTLDRMMLFNGPDDLMLSMTLMLGWIAVIGGAGKSLSKRRGRQKA